LLNAQSTKPKSESEALLQIVNDYVAQFKLLDLFYAPEWSMEENYSQFGDGLSVENEKRTKKLFFETAAKLKKINPKKLSGDDAITYQLFKSDMDNALEWFRYDFKPLGFNQLGNRLQGYMLDAGENQGSFPFNKKSHFEAFIKRSEGFSTYVDNLILTLRRGIKSKLVIPCVLIEKTRNTYAPALEKDVEKNPFYEPTKRFSKDISKKEAEGFRLAFKEMIQKNILFQRSSKPLK
jgi:uncharacterized protein (DUF885 family)